MRRSLDRFSLALIFLYLAGVFVLSVQPLETMISSGFQGVYYKGGDESQYIMRMQDALQRPWTDVSNAITSGYGAPKGLQMSFLEMVAGSSFGWIGLSATALTVLLSILLAPLSIICVTVLSLRLGATRRLSLLAGLLTFILLFGPLRRVIHQSWSLPFTFSVVLLVLAWLRRPTRLRSLCLGLLLGIAPGVYFWSWSFLWTYFGVIVLLSFIERMYRKEAGIARGLLVETMKTGCVAIVTALPFLVLLWVNGHHPNASDTAIRSSLIHAAEFESVRRSLILGILLLGTIVWSLRAQDWKKSIPACALVLSLFIVLHQQFLHGLVLSYWTHYYPYVCAVSLALGATLLSQRRRFFVEYAMLLAITLFLVGAFFDYKGRLSFAEPPSVTQKVQHLSGMIAALQADDSKQTVLSDPQTSLMIGNATFHDVVFTSFLRHVLVSNQELAERYCLTELLNPRGPDTEWLAYDIRELSAAGRAATQRVLEDDLRITDNACVWVMAHPQLALGKYGVTLLAWDERHHPDWKIKEQLFAPLVKGPGWSLWRVR